LTQIPAAAADDDDDDDDALKKIRNMDEVTSLLWLQWVTWKHALSRDPPNEDYANHGLRQTQYSSLSLLQLKQNFEKNASTEFITLSPLFSVNIITSCYVFSNVLAIILSDRPLKIRTDGGHARVRELGFIGIFSFLL